MASSSSSWTPFTCLPPAALTPSGLVQFDAQDQEVELIRRGPLELRWQQQQGGGGGNNGNGNDGNGNGNEPMAPCPKGVSTRGSAMFWQSRHASLQVIVTTHRLVFQEESNSSNNNHNNNNNNNMTQQNARFVHLSNVHQIEATGGPSFLHPNASHKLVIRTFTYTAGELVVALTQKQHRDGLHDSLSLALQRKQWEMATRLQEQEVLQTSMARRRVGVDHILTKNKLKHQHAAQLAEDALSGDAEQLLQQASALLQVIQKYTKLLQQQQKSANDNSDAKDANTNNATTNEDAEKLALMLQDMGMTSALTKDHFASSSSKGGRREGGNSKKKKKDEADASYYEWLARQLVDFLWTRLPTMGGVISLTDVYCLWNRARGTNLISPEDLRQACDLLREGEDGGALNHLGISQRTFDSGVVVLQMDKQQGGDNSNNNNNNKFQGLVDMCPTTALEASHVLKVSPLLALEQLKQAEQEGWLCRDTTLETTRFYPNRFESFVVEIATK
jgi:ESCRT-II complex subunit VPS36